LVVAYAFEHLALRSLQAKVLKRNPASVRLLQKSGFLRTGVAPPTDLEPEELLVYTRRVGPQGDA
jgi:RimJ/RimL family protein N-acetyltransferase